MVLVRFSDHDYIEFEVSYSRVSQRAKRHDKSTLVSYVAAEIYDLQRELDVVDPWFKRVKGYKG